MPTTEMTEVDVTAVERMMGLGFSYDTALKFWDLVNPFLLAKLMYQDCPPDLAIQIALYK